MLSMLAPEVFPKRPHQARIDLTGKRFGALIVIGYGGAHKGVSTWWCKCDCGNVSKPGYLNLRVGRSKSCGCQSRKIAPPPKKYGDVYADDIPEYATWHGMKQRCYNAKSTSYRNYGGRGIKVCDRWLKGDGKKSGFQCFLDDMGAKPSKSLSLDRYPNTNGNYEPDNCRWATRKQQAASRRKAKSVSLRWRPIATAPRDGTLMIYMGIGIVAAPCYWHMFQHKWIDPDRPGVDVFPTWWASIPYGYGALD